MNKSVIKILEKVRVVGLSPFLVGVRRVSNRLPYAPKNNKQEQ